MDNLQGNKLGVNNVQQKAEDLKKLWEEIIAGADLPQENVSLWL